ncbi:MAG: DNA-directed RNA polymerase subunit alpha [Candidatus Kaiserbacteria bacterium]|nr:DNA-directed RNA polymerase subunit alpha [Candidatus Kaiserbacteria bacterium]
MTEYINIAVPSKPEMISEEGDRGTYEISNLYPGYGNTLGNALRRMLLSSIPGTAVTAVRIKNVPHEFSVIDGVKEDALTVVVNMKNIRVRANTEVFPQTITLKKSGVGPVTAGDFETPSQIEIVNKDLVIAEITDGKTELSIEADVLQGIGFRPREDLASSDAVDSIFVDAMFSPVRRSAYEVHNMRVGDRTDFNRLVVSIETDGTVTPRQALDKVVRTMIAQFEAMTGFQEEGKEKKVAEEGASGSDTITIDDLGLSAGVVSILEKNEIRTVMDILKRGIVGIRDLPGIGDKAMEEIVTSLESRGISFKDAG